MSKIPNYPFNLPAPPRTPRSGGLNLPGPLYFLEHLFPLASVDRTTVYRFSCRDYSECIPAGSVNRDNQHYGHMGSICVMRHYSLWTKSEECAMLLL